MIMIVPGEYRNWAEALMPDPNRFCAESVVDAAYLVGADGMILAKHTGPLTLESAGALLAKAPR